MKGLTKEQERKERIRAVKMTIVKALNDGLSIDENRLRIQVQESYGIREELALEYIKTAKEQVSLITEMTIDKDLTKEESEALNARIK